MNQDIENILYKIINGYYIININNISYKIISPNINIKHEANCIYTNIIDDNKYDIFNWINSNQINHLLLINNIWNSSVDDLVLDKTIKSLDSLKIELFRNFSNLSSRSFIKNSIVDLNKNIISLYNRKHYFDYLTLEFYAQNIKNQYLVSNMVYTLDNKKVFDYDTLDKVHAKFLDNILSEIYDNAIDTVTIKKIVRLDLWKSLWNISKEKIFKGSAKDWTDEQKSLVNFSKVLDSIREHPECPSEDILNDDDALDGWILYQNQKKETEQKKEQLLDKHNLKDKKAGELFVLTSDKNEKEEIYNLNDNQINRDIKEMIGITKKEGKIKWAELPHVKRELQQQVLQQSSRK